MILIIIAIAPRWVGVVESDVAERLGREFLEFVCEVGVGVERVDEEEVSWLDVDGHVVCGNELKGDAVAGGENVGFVKSFEWRFVEIDPEVAFGGG